MMASRPSPWKSRAYEALEVPPTIHPMDRGEGSALFDGQACDCCSGGTAGYWVPIWMAHEFMHVHNDGKDTKLCHNCVRDLLEEKRGCNSGR